MGTMFWISIVVFALVYALIIWDVLPRMMVALGGAVIIIIAGVLDQEEAFACVDFNTVGLLIGMMIIVGVLQDTGVFEYVAVKSAKLAGGDPIKMLIFMGGATAVASAMLDNVTTVLVMVPTTFAICGRMKLPVVPYLITEVLASNIGGTATLIGDPPNMMIGSATGLSFFDFVKHLAPVVVIILAVTLGLLILIYRKQLIVSRENRERVYAFDEKEDIADKKFLLKSMIVFVCVIVGFFIQRLAGLEPATIALGGAVALLIVTNYSPEKVMKKVEWPTIFFFIGLFILVGGLEHTGAIEMMAEKVIAVTNGDERLAGILILWMSAVVSAFIDNIPLVATFIPLLQEIGAAGIMNTDQLWWALSLGACLGGNGTLIGASANVVVAGIAMQKGVRITFGGFTKVAFPLMLISIVIANIYLLMFFL